VRAFVLLESKCTTKRLVADPADMRFVATMSLLVSGKFAGFSESLTTLVTLQWFPICICSAGLTNNLFTYIINVFAFGSISQLNFLHTTFFTTDQLLFHVTQ